MSNGNNSLSVSEETRVRQDNSNSTNHQHAAIKSCTNKKKYNQSKITNDIIETNKRERDERMFTAVFLQIILKHPKINQQLKSNIRTIVQSCTRQNRITHQPLVPLLESKLSKIISPSIWNAVERLALEHCCRKML